MKHSKPPLPNNQKEEVRLNRRFDAIEEKAPNAVSRVLAVLRRPAMMLVRIPLGILLVLGGIFSFLPVLGVWMLPLGLLLLAIDVVVLRGPVNRVVFWAERKWRAWRPKK